PVDLSGVAAISAAWSDSLALKRDGTVVAWGCRPGDYGQCSTPSGLCGVTAIAAGTLHSLALAPTQLCQTIAFAPLVTRTYDSPGCSISVPPLAKKTYGAPDFRVSATASSGLPVSFSGSGKCAVSGAIVHLTGAGSCIVTALHARASNYAAAPNVSRAFSITAAPCRVPKVVGKKVGAAKQTIAKRHCRTGKVGHAYSTKHKKGVVISQSRRPGRVLPARSKINLVVSRGRLR